VNTLAALSEKIMDNKELIKRLSKIDDPIDKRELEKELKNILVGMKKVSEGFLQIAQAANRMRDKKLYRHLGYSTFNSFCIDLIGLTRKQVYLYIRIAEISKSYHDIIDERFILSMGPTKMNEINKGIEKIENSSLKKRDKRKMIEMVISKVGPELTVAETEKIVKEFTRNIK
jgi:hypothetical protein